jgi:two-component sensor histidine kinase/PAS domain-containing protein
MDEMIGREAADGRAAQAPRSDGAAAGIVMRNAGRIALVGVVLMVLAATAAVMAVVFTNGVVRLNARANDVRAHINVIGATLAEMEAAEAGFLVSQSPQFRAQFQKSRASLAQQYEEIVPLISSDQQRALLTRARDVSEAVARRAERVVQLAANGDLEQARAEFGSQFGSGDRGRARAILDEISLLNADAIAASREEYRAATRRQMTALVLAAMAILLFGLHQVASSNRFVREVADSREKLRHANLDLEAQVEARAQELSQANQLLTAALAAARVTASRQNASMALTWVHNPQTGMLDGDVIGKTDLEAFPASAGRDALVAAKRRVLASGQGETLEAKFGASDCSRWFRIRLDPLREDGRTAGVIAAAVDITEDRRARRRLRELSNELAGTVQRFDLALRAANVVVFAQDAERHFTWISRDLFGMPPSEITGRREEDVLPPDVQAVAIPAKDAVLRTGQPREYDYSIAAGNERRWFRARAEPVFDPAGKPSGIVGAVIDVTTENVAQQRLRAVTDELAATVARFDVALRGADVFVFAQDRERRLTFASDRMNELSPLELLGHTDEDLLPGEIASIVVPAKEQVLATGEPLQLHLALPGDAGGTRWQKIHMEPSKDPSGAVVGLIGCAVDVTAERLGQQRERRLADELRLTVQRFQVALRGADVTVFTQDGDLAYTWVSQDFLNRKAGSFIGLTDQDVLPPEMSPRLVDFKRAVLERGEAQQGEFRFPNPVNERWYFIRAEPQRDETGAIVGLLAAAVDVTERRQRETHIRILLRELTHRTKNLLAVVQAMARQTLTTSTSAGDFEARFSGRLQGLAASLDILVSEDWEGASIDELVRSQLGHYRDFVGGRIVLDGPDVRLEPEAAQNIGLALHELGTNSSKYGALSVPTGRVEIAWEFLPGSAGRSLRFTWRETGGPPARPPSRKGFGYAVLERLVPRALGGHADISYGPGGLSWSVDLDASHLRESDEVPEREGEWVG